MFNICMKTPDGVKNTVAISNDFKRACDLAKKNAKRFNRAVYVDRQTVTDTAKLYELLSQDVPGIRYCYNDDSIILANTKRAFEVLDKIQQSNYSSRFSYRGQDVHIQVWK